VKTLVGVLLPGRFRGATSGVVCAGVEQGARVANLSSAESEAVHVAGQISKSVLKLLGDMDWSLRQLAREAHISPETVSKLARASRPDVSVITLLRIQRAMKLNSLEVLLGGGEVLPSQRLAEQVSLPMELPPPDAPKPPRARKRQPLTP